MLWIRKVGLVTLLLLSGSCSTSTLPEGSAVNQLIQGQTWQVEDVERRGIVDSSMITIKFDEKNGQVTGTSGCNRYFGSYERKGKRFSIGPLAGSRRACVPALMNQEQRFLAALQSVTQARWLDKTRIELQKEESESTLTLIKLDTQAQRKTSVNYLCDDESALTARFAGPERLIIETGNQSLSLQRQESASGARYIGRDVEFWTKGKEATLVKANDRLLCQQQS